MYKKSKKSLLQLVFAGSLMFYAFSGITSVLNYAFYPIIARFVSVGDYGQIQFLVSMFTQLAVGFVVLNILAIIIGAELTNKSGQKQAIRSLNVIASVVTVVITTIGVSVLLTQKEALGLSSSAAIIALGLSLIATVPFTVAIGQLQGNNRFVASGVLSMLAALFKLIFSTLLVALGFGVTGAISGILIGVALSLAVVEIVKHRQNRKLPQASNIKAGGRLSNLSFIRKRAIVALLAITIITMLSAADSITSRLVLSTVDAGHYAAVATVTKIILATTSPLVWLALPPALTNNRKQVFRYFVITLAVSALVGILISAFAAPATKLLTGVDAGSYVIYVPMASLAMALCATAFLLMSVTICLDKLRLTLVSVGLSIAVLVCVFLIGGANDPLMTALVAQSLASAVLVLGGLYGVLRHNPVVRIPL